MKQIPLKISNLGLRATSITLVSEIDRNMSVRVEERFFRNERILKSAKAQLSNDWREYFFGELIYLIKEERRKLLSEMDGYNIFQQINKSFEKIMNKIPEFIDGEELKNLDNTKNLG